MSPFRKRISISGLLWEKPTFGCAASQSMSIRAGCRGWGGSFNSTMAKQMSDPSHVSMRLRNAALHAIAEACETSLGSDKSEEATWLHQVIASAPAVGTTLSQSLRNPAPDDERLLKLARELSLSSVEILVIALACAVEEKAIVGRVLAHIQAPIGGSRPTLGLLSHAFAAAVGEGLDILPALVNGVAVQSGLLVVHNENAPLPERPEM